MKLGKQLLISAICAIFVFGVGYAVLSDTITVTGTASTTGSLDINVESATFTSSTGGGVAGDQTVSVGDDTVTLAVPALQYPGASVTFTIDLKNDGTVPGKLTAINTTGGASTDPAPTDLSVTYSGLTVNDVIGASGTDTVTVTVTWLETSEAGFTAQPFNIEFVFTQDI